jgi:hypothetical protein
MGPSAALSWQTVAVAEYPFDVPQSVEALQGAAQIAPSVRFDWQTVAVAEYPFDAPQSAPALQGAAQNAPLAP